MIALGYIRRSEKPRKGEARERTVSLQEQEAQVRAYCAAQGWQLAEVLEDDGVSGGNRERLVKLTERIKATKARAVVCYHLDRFARDVAALLDTLRAWTKQGIALHVVGRGEVEAETSNGLLVTGIEGLIAEHYRRLTGEKTRDALARLRADGRRTSRWIPYGYQEGEAGKPLPPDPKEQAAIAALAALPSGLSLRQAAKQLAEQGHVARSGRPLGPSMIARLRRRVR